MAFSFTGDELSRFFPTKSALDALYPAGIYQLSNPGGAPIVLSFGVENYPPTPKILNGIWNAGILLLNPAQANTINISAFPGFAGTGAGTIAAIRFYGLNDNVELEEVRSTVVLDGEGVSASPPTGLTIPAGTLIANNMYFCEVSFDVLSLYDHPAANPGSLVATSYSKQLGVVVAAQPTGTTTAVPVITTQPQNQTGVVGGSATFNVGVTVNGSPQLGTVYVEWMFNGVDISRRDLKYTISADEKTLTVNNLSSADAGSYSYFAANAGGLARSSPALLSVGAATAQPTNQTSAIGQSVLVMATPAGGGSPVLGWSKDGTTVAGATTSMLTLNNFQPADAGIYSMNVAVGGGAASSKGAVVGPASAAKVIPATLQEFADILHLGTGFTYDQILMQGPAATVKPDAGQILRISFIDLNDDIVQVEFFGPGNLTLSLENPTGPAEPGKYNQTGVNYMKGRPSIVVTGATEETNLSIFSVGTLVNGNPNLYKAGVSYDGFSDVAYVAISSSNGKFGGLRAGNVVFSSTKGYTGLYAPGVQFVGPTFIGDISATELATPVLLIGSGADTRITGGDLLQPNGRSVQVDGLTKLKFTDGINSHGIPQPFKSCNGRLEKDGIEVGPQIVVYPTP